MLYQQEFQAGYDEGIKSLVREMVKRRVKIQCMLGEAPEIIQGEYNYLKKLEGRLEDKVKGKKGSDIFWITINVKPEVDLDTVRSTTCRLVSRLAFSRLIYGFDQRADEEDKMGEGIHIHAILPQDRGVRKSHVTTWVYSTFRQLVSDKAKVDVKQYTADYFQDKIAYIKGDKFEEDKHKVAHITKIWRNAYNLYDIYNFEESKINPINAGGGVAPPPADKEEMD